MSLAFEALSSLVGEVEPFWKLDEPAVPAALP
jgi:hypothetical protein